MWIPGPKLTTVFASRWKALFWAVTVLGTAYGIAEVAPSNSGEAQSTLGAIAGQPPAVDSSAQTSPWAKNGSKP